MTARRGAPLLAALLLSGVALTACGGGSQLSISNGAARQLQAQVATVQSDATAGDSAAAARDLRTLVMTVATLTRSGQLSAERADAILAAARVVQTDLALVPTTTTTTTTTTTLPPREPKGPKRDAGPGQGGDGNS